MKKAKKIGKTTFIDDMYDVSKERNLSLTKVEIKEFMNLFQSTLTKELSEKKDVLFAGFMRFTQAHVKGRNGRNPQTGKKMHLKAHDTLRVKLSPSYIKEIMEGK